MCQDLFGETLPIAQLVNDTNIEFGGNTPYGATNIVFVNGAIDPWHALSVWTDFAPTVTAVQIADGAHCSDMQQPGPTTSPDIIAAQAQISLQIGQWLQQ
jgi:serine protease 16